MGRCSVLPLQLCSRLPDVLHLAALAHWDKKALKFADIFFRQLIQLIGGSKSIGWLLTVPGCQSCRSSFPKSPWSIRMVNFPPVFDSSWESSACTANIHSITLVTLYLFMVKPPDLSLLYDSRDSWIPVTLPLWCRRHWLPLQSLQLCWCCSKMTKCAIQQLRNPVQRFNTLIWFSNHPI